MGLRLTILFILISTISRGQQNDFELTNIKFKGLEFKTTKENIIKSFGQGKKLETDYECGFFTNDQSGGPYYQLVYADFNYIGSDKEDFVLQSVKFDLREPLITLFLKINLAINLFGQDISSKKN
jgi:predicted proteasome-type protease